MVESWLGEMSIIYRTIFFFEKREEIILFFWVVLCSRNTYKGLEDYDG